MCNRYLGRSNLYNLWNLKNCTSAFKNRLLTVWLNHRGSGLAYVRIIRPVFDWFSDSKNTFAHSTCQVLLPISLDKYDQLRWQSLMCHTLAYKINRLAWMQFQSSSSLTRRNMALQVLNSRVKVRIKPVGSRVFVFHMKKGCFMDKTTDGYCDHNCTGDIPVVCDSNGYIFNRWRRVRIVAKFFTKKCAYGFV